jgi:hypothetical protein
MAVFWIVAPYSLVDVYRHIRGTYCLHHRPDDGGSKGLWNVGKRLPDYTAQHPRRQPSSDSPQWEPQMSLIFVLLFWNVRLAASVLSEVRVPTWPTWSMCSKLIVCSKRTTASDGAAQRAIKYNPITGPTSHCVIIRDWTCNAASQEDAILCSKRLYITWNSKL